MLHCEMLMVLDIAVVDPLVHSLPHDFHYWTGCRNGSMFCIIFEVESDVSCVAIETFGGCFVCFIGTFVYPVRRIRAVGAGLAIGVCAMLLPMTELQASEALHERGELLYMYFLMIDIKATELHGPSPYTGGGDKDYVI